MKKNKVVMVIKDGNPLPDWVPERLKNAGIEFSESICWDKEELTRYAADADIVWSYGGRHHLLEGENLTVLKKCGAILRTGAGTDNVDRKTATKMGIIITNTPYAVTAPVSDHTISLLFSLVRQVAHHDRLIRHGKWDTWTLKPHRRFHGATLGFVGFGRVPRLMTRKLSGFTMNFIAYDLYVKPEVMTFHDVKQVSLDELLQTSDYVSLHCPLTEKTHHLIGERELRLMQPHSLLINTSRGSVIDESALIKALQEGLIAGAALDVLEKEPPAPDNPLLTMENVILTAHFAGNSDTFPQDMCEASVETIIDLAEGRWPRSVVNPEVMPRWGKLSPPKCE